MTLTTLALLGSILACGNSASDDTGTTTTHADGGTTATQTDGGTASDGGTSGDTGTANDGGTSGDTGTASDGGTSAGSGILEFVGSGTAWDNKYSGTESLVFTGDSGGGDVLCQLSYSVTSTAPRTDCPDCDWAYDVVYGDVSVDIDTDGICDTIGWGAAAQTAWAGSTNAYGFIADYFGHAPVLMMEIKGKWEPVDFASWDETSGAFSYSWETGEASY